MVAGQNLKRVSYNLKTAQIFKLLGCYSLSIRNYCSHQHYGETYCVHIRGLAASFSPRTDCCNLKTNFTIQHSRQRRTTEYADLYGRCCRDPKSWITQVTRITERSVILLLNFVIQFSVMFVFVLTGFVFNRSLCTFSYFEFYCSFLSSWQEFRNGKYNLLSCCHLGLPSKNAKCVCSNMFKNKLRHRMCQQHIFFVPLLRDKWSEILNKKLSFNENNYMFLQFFFHIFFCLYTYYFTIVSCQNTKKYV